MFNTTRNTSITKTSVSFNAPATGIMQKSAPNSKFIRFHEESKTAICLFGPEPKMYTNNEDVNAGYESRKKPVTLLQVLLTTNGFLVEYIFDEDITE